MCFALYSALWETHKLLQLYTRLSYSGNFKEVSKKKHPITLSNVCEMYLQFVAVVKNFASDILIGLGCNETIVYKMWHFFKATSGLQFKEICRMKLHANILSLFSQMMMYLLK